MSPRYASPPEVDCIFCRTIESTSPISLVCSKNVSIKNFCLRDFNSTVNVNLSLWKSWTYIGSDVLAPFVHNAGTRWRCVVNFTCCFSSQWERNSQYPWMWPWLGPLSPYRCFELDKTFFSAGTRMTTPYTLSRHSRRCAVYAVQAHNFN